MKIALILHFLPLLTSAYNLEVENAMIYTTPSSDNQLNQNNHSFFGYSVLLYSKKLNSTLDHGSWMIVGAPKANYTGQNKNKPKIPKEPGIAYVCQLPGDCASINVPNPEDTPLIQAVNYSFIITKGHGWFGAAMSLSESDDSFTVCAPRTPLELYTNGTMDIHSVHGACYIGKLPSPNLSIEGTLRAIYGFGGLRWISPLNGFVVHHPRSQASSESKSPVVGSPTHNKVGVLMDQGGYNKLWNITTNITYPLLGYAISSGYYFNKSKLMVAGGAPEWEYVGQVVIMDYHKTPHSFRSELHGTEMGDFFGASLTTGDMNNDGLDDLIVGAPHWKNDNGRVYIYLGKEDGFFIADILLDGRVNDALYGYALTCGDLDGDDLDDLVVAAPWEESGVIYVYNGDAMLREFHSIEPSQRITASSISNDILRFGFSLSNILDVDGNNFSDIAVGAYDSGHAVLLKSKPIVKTTIKLSTITPILLQNTTSFLLTVCRHQIPNQKWGGEITVSVDILRKRVNKTVHKHQIQNPEACINISIFLQNNITNYWDDIDITAEHQFLDRGKLGCLRNKTSGNLCPIEYKRRNATARMRLQFDIGCGLKHICEAFILAELVFPDIRNSTLIIGSNDLKLALMIRNNAQPAFSTNVTFTIPKGIYLKSILPFCREEEDREALRVTCDVGNPLQKDVQKNISLILDVNNLRNASLHGTELNFTADIRTRSGNQGNSTVAIPLKLKANVSIALKGKRYADIMSYGFNAKPSKFIFQHVYRISRYGVTPLSAITLKILVFIQGHYHSCSVTDISDSKERFAADKFVVEATMDNHWRSRRMSSKDSLNTPFFEANVVSTTVANNTSQLQFDRIIPAQLYRELERGNDDVIYMNCSTPNVICGQVTCMINFLTTANAFALLPIQLVAHVSKLKGRADEGQKVIIFATEAFVDVQNPKLTFDIPGNGISVQSTTIFRRTSNSWNDYSIFNFKKYDRPLDEISAELILGSILLGLLILGLIAVILRHMGFFERRKKKELNARMSEEATTMNMHFMPEDVSDSTGLNE